MGGRLHGQSHESSDLQECGRSILLELELSDVSRRARTPGAPAFFPARSSELT